MVFPQRGGETSSQRDRKRHAGIGTLILGVICLSALWSFSKCFLTRGETWIWREKSAQGLGHSRESEFRKGFRWDQVSGGLLFNDAGYVSGSGGVKESDSDPKSISLT